MIIKLLKELLQNLDPSNFQNVIIGALAVYIPVVIDIFNYNKNPAKTSRFMEIVFNEYRFKSKYIFIYSVIGLVFFSFVSGVEVCFSVKLFSIILIFYLVGYFLKYITSILPLSRNFSSKYAHDFLEKSSNKVLSKNIFYELIGKQQKENQQQNMLDAWKTYWKEKLESDEKKVTNIFLKTVDKAVKLGRVDLASELLGFYIENISNRKNKNIVELFLPKFFEWNKEIYFMFNKKIQEENNKFADKKIDNSLCYWCQPYFFENIIKKIFLNKRNEKNSNNICIFFQEFKKHIDKIEGEHKALVNNEQENENIDDFLRKYCKNLFEVFCDVFFDNVNEIISCCICLLRESEERYFPKEWKINSENKNNFVDKIIFAKFIKWYKKNCKNNSKELAEKCPQIIAVIFPTVKGTIFFKDFLKLYVCNYDIDKAEKVECDFDMPSFLSSRFSLQDKSDSKLLQKIRSKDLNDECAFEIKRRKNARIAKKETAKIILNYFLDGIEDKQKSVEYLKTQVDIKLDVNKNPYLISLKNLCVLLNLNLPKHSNIA